MSAKSILAERAETLPASPLKLAFGCPRDFLDNRFVYVAISSRARGLSIGVNMNPNRFCNFDCVYCEVDRVRPAGEKELDVAVMTSELEKTLLLIHSGQIRLRAPYSRLSPDLLQLRHVALSGDGEPTMSLDFAQVVQSVVHLRAQRTYPYFKVALLTNGTWLDLRQVQEGLQYFTHQDEVWIKLDAGTQAYMDKVNHSEVALEKVLQNILKLGKQRTITIQSLFVMIDGQEPPPEEITQYIARLNELKNGGAQLGLVQIYSAARPTTHIECSHLPLRSLSAICRRIRTETGLKAEVF